MTMNALIDRSRKHPEDWRYTDLQKLLPKAAQRVPEQRLAVPSSAMAARLFFVDGVWIADRSILGDLPQNILRGDRDRGYEIEIAGETCLVTQPIELVFLTTAAGPSEVSVKLAINLGPSARVTIIESHHIDDSVKSARTELVDTEIRLGHQAKFVHGKLVVHGMTQIATTNVSISEGAYYDNFSLIVGGDVIRNEVIASINGPLAQCTLNGVMLLDDENHADTLTRVVHTAPHGTSQQYYKTVAGGRSRGVFQGKVSVAENAQKTDSQQLSRALLLSDQAEIDAKPELEINADDVKCSHGCTIGDIDAEALFYLQARGIPENEARSLLVRAFVDDAIDQINILEWRAMCRANVERWLNERL